jgi:hypothetical protein
VTLAIDPGIRTAGTALPWKAIVPTRGATRLLRTTCERGVEADAHASNGK